MRVDLIILFASCALAASSSNASNVRRNPISSAIVQSVAESQHGLPVNRLLRGHETIINEERAPNLQNLIPSKAMLRSKLPSENDLKLFLAKGDGTPATALEAREFSKLVKALTKKKPDMSKIAGLSGKRGDRDVTMTLFRLKESGKLDEDVAVKLMKNQFSYLQHQADAKGKSVFDIVLKTNNLEHPISPFSPISLFNGEIEVLENYLRWQKGKLGVADEINGELDVANELVRSLAKNVGHPRFVSMISKNHLNPEAQRLEVKLYKLLFEDAREMMRLTRDPERMRPARERERMRRTGESEANSKNLPSGTVVVDDLFRFGEIKKMGVELLNGKDVLNLMGRFYLKSPGSQSIPDVRTTVKALKAGLAKYRTALLISKAVENEEQAINSVAKELEIEYFKQEEFKPDKFEQWALDRTGDSDRGTIGKFIERYREFDRNERKELNGGEGGPVAST